MNSTNVLAHFNKNPHTVKFPLHSGEFYDGSLVAKSCPTLATPWTVALQAPLSIGFSRQESWSGLPFPSPEDLLDPGIEPESLALQADSLPTELIQPRWSISKYQVTSTPYP